LSLPGFTVFIDEGAGYVSGLTVTGVSALGRS
jgi:hypothetical protein